MPLNSDELCAGEATHSMLPSSRVPGGVAVSCLLVLSTATVLAQDGAAAGSVAVEDAYVEHINYAYAQVLRVVPVHRDIQVVQRREDCESIEREPAAAAPTRRNGVNGVFQAGFAAPAASLASRPDSTTVDEPAGCPVVEEPVTITRHEGYDVEYRYRGEVFVSRLDHDPGDRLRIRVAVAPAADAQSARQDEWSTANPSY